MPQTNLVHLEKCPLCASDQVRADRVVNGWSLWKCTDCSTLFLNPIPRDIGSLYQDASYYSERKISFNNPLRSAERFYPLIALLALFVNKQHNVRFVEIGPGNGSLSLAAKAAGWDVLCIELSQYAGEQLASLGLPVALLDEGKLPVPAGTVDVVVMHHVIEHLPYPATIVSSVAESLKRGGILYIVTPNYASLDRLYHGDKWSGWDLPFHLTHYTPSTLKRTLNAAGLALIYRDFAFFNPIRHLLLGLRKKDLRADIRGDLFPKNTTVDHGAERGDPSAPKQFTFNARVTPAWKMLIKRVLAERDMTLVARKS